MGDIKNPGILKALRDFDDHETGYDKAASKAHSDDSLTRMLSEQQALLTSDPRIKLQCAINDELAGVIRDVAVMLANLGGSVLALRRAVELLAKDMPAANPHRMPGDSLFDSRK